ncbi:LysE family translocator [Saccharothrix variisporea]|uniref:LysE family translocator n=1 Tax=Saccharothrix variisporea TaxID=543527 RepID=UPI0011C42E04|nr:LysE family transporter [Saccharothrix variisporea]
MLNHLPLFAVWILAVVSPGPDMLVVAQQATTRSRRHGVVTGLGVASAIAVWAVASMLGLSVLLARVGWLYDVVRLAGAAYLVYLGARALWASRRTERVPVEPVDATPTSAAKAWRTGFLTNIGNPKAAVFFGSLFGALLPADTTPWGRVAVVVAMVLVAASWFALVATLFGLPRVVEVYRRGRRWVDRVTGIAFVALGSRLALDR